MKVDPNKLKIIKKDGRVLNPRCFVGDTKELQDDIDTIGQAEPAQVVRVGSDLYIVGGHRRSAACRNLGIDVEVTVIREYTSEAALLADYADILHLMASLNNRSEIPVAVVDGDGEIIGGHAAVAKALAESGRNRNQVAAALGYKQPNDAASLVSLHGASDKTKRAVGDGSLGLTVYGRYLRSLTPEEQDQVLLMAASYSRSAVESAYNRFVANKENPVAPRASDEVDHHDEIESDEESYEPEIDRMIALGEMEALARQIRFGGKPLVAIERQRRDRIIELLGAMK